MADKNKMSVEEILAACRKNGGGAGAKSPPPAAKEAAEVVEPAGNGEEPASAKAPVKEPKAAAAKKPAGSMSVAEMLAAARSEKSGGAKPAAKKEPAAEKAIAAKAAPVAKKAAAPKAEKEDKPSAKTTTAAGPKDTQSILAAARKGAKPGPMSKAEAASHAPGAEAKGAKKAFVAPPMPAKPAYAVPRPGAPAPREERRTFLGVFFGSFLAVGFTSLGLTHLLWGLGLARFMFPNILTEPPTKFKVGFPSNLSPGAVEEKFKAQFGVWIVRYEYQGQPEIYALRTVCTHLGCTPNWLEAEQKFKCPCHGSGFYKDGINFEGPAPRPLERYAIRLADDGQLEVDKSRIFQEEMGQWSDPASFVPA